MAIDINAYDFKFGTNLKTIKIRKIKSKMTSFNFAVDKPYTRACALLRELLLVQTISRKNCIFGRKFLDRMKPFFQDPNSVAEIEKIEELFVKARERRDRRRDKKLAKKAQATTTTSHKQPTPAPPVTAPDDIWSM